MAIVTGSVYDNYWVQHPIPRSDFQYSWITASILHSDPYPPHTLTYGYAPADGFVSSSAVGVVAAYNFVSASDFVSYLREQSPHPRAWGDDDVDNRGLPNSEFPTDFVGMSTNVVEPVSSSKTYWDTQSIWIFNIMSITETLVLQ